MLTAAAADVRPCVHTPAMNLNHVTLPSRDVVRAAAFYRGLGLTQIVAAPPRYARFTLPAGDSTLSLHHVDAPLAASHVELGLECASADELDALVARLQQAGHPLVHAPIDQSWRWREARIQDPDGNVLLLFHGGAIRRDPPWKVPPGYAGP